MKKITLLLTLTALAHADWNVQYGPSVSEKTNIGQTRRETTDASTYEKKTQQNPTNKNQNMYLAPAMTAQEGMPKSLGV